MFLYELGVDESARGGRRAGAALVAALGELARERGATGCGSAPSSTTRPPSPRTASAGAGVPEPGVVLTWTFDVGVDDLALLRLEHATLWVSDDDGRLLHCRTPEPEPPPLLVVGAVRSGLAWATSVDVPAAVVDAVAAVLEGEPSADGVGWAPRRRTRCSRRWPWSATWPRRTADRRSSCPAAARATDDAWTLRSSADDRRWPGCAAGCPSETAA